MMNLFDFSTSMAGTKKAFGDGSVGGRNRLVVANRATDPDEIHPEDRSFTFELMRGSSVKKSSTKPMKMLIAQEMSKEMDTKRKSPNVVARLMGLDDILPGDSEAQSAKRNLHDGGSGQIHAEVKLQSFCNENADYREAYEIHQRPSRLNSFNDQVLQKGQHYEKRMALVREKFVEAKRLATDEKLLESKEFHDALEILSSNRDLFLKFLEEPNSLLSSNLEEHHSIPSPPQTRHITVLKPSRTNEMKSKVKQHQYATASEMQKSLWCSSFNHRPMTEKLSQPTRIVVLKPSPKKHFDTKSPESSTASSPEPPERGDCYGGINTQDSMGSREAAKDFKQQMHESLSRHRRDESLLSSVFSNGYFGDDSSFNRSDNYVEEEDCNNTDSAITSSWDYMSNRFGSPCSHSSLSRASYSPESSVIREAKKRLSERWALVTSSELHHENLQARSSSTLGEMLAINELQIENRDDMEPCISGIRSRGKKEDFKMIASDLSIGTIKDDNREGSFGSLSRSKSAPTTSLTYGNIALRTEDSESRAQKSVVIQGSVKSRGGKSSFKGRVSSLFSLKNKKGGRDESASSPCDALQIGSFDIVVHKHDESLQAIQSCVNEVSPAGDFEAVSCLISSPIALNNTISDKSKTSTKVDLCHEEHEPSSENQETLRIPEKIGENQDHPSPTSTLDAPFKDDTNENTLNSSKLSISDNPQALSRSMPIESIARSLSWDDSRSNVLSTSPLKLSRAFCKSGEDDPEDLMLVENLLTASGLCKNRLSTIFNGWHSPEIPLDPMLLDKLSDTNDKVVKNKKTRSNQKLIYDCVNVVLREIACSAEQGAFQHFSDDETLLAGRVWPVVKNKLCEARNGGPVVDRLLGREVSGRGWTELMQTEIAAISNEIGVQVLDDLFGEALVELNVG